MLTIEEEAVIVAFRRHALLPLDDCLDAIQATIPHLTRSALHRCLQRHGISRFPEVAGDKTPKRMFKTYPIGYFHIHIAEVQTAEGKLRLFVAIDRTSKFAFRHIFDRVCGENSIEHWLTKVKHRWANGQSLPRRRAAVERTNRTIKCRDQAPSP